MKTPDTIAGRITEAVMSNITRKVGIGKLPPHTYNPIYSAVLETLEKEIPENGVLASLSQPSVDSSNRQP